MSEVRRTIVWWSTGAASAVAARLALQATPSAIVARCETGNEDDDNYRFEVDVQRWINRPITILKSEKYLSVPDVWDDRKYMSGIKGAPCTVEMKVVPRLVFQLPTDIHVFGYTADSHDVERFKTLRETYPELIVRAPLIDAGITKAGTLAIVEAAGIRLPRSYALGFPNANCLKTGCVKATSPDYWALYRFHFPDEFAVTAATARRLGVRLCRIKDERRFIDEIPMDWPMANPVAPACDFLCHLAEVGL
ncbi:MAG: hypothetical protein EOR77_25770 [Mesorhizobium sp.]|uniref:hypothetical protein n=1 Tax=Mesorhizobium sp. TaxID=1871066 RepID=UPI000FE5C8A8|nr:hypothetical protein [Mesorhizobium sp.]RWH88002.1 MAG: hypothetical protein EOQ87_23260 [Mesorhizobium sp.]RWM30237.1 MAG: hypothetical protein EOR77_25770 [Mesorhizobium sp.]TJV32048.1 MAG: hypothetical protein E5X87_21380 [Mesorhizobium sp.]